MNEKNQYLPLSEGRYSNLKPGDLVEIQVAPHSRIVLSGITKHVEAQ